MADLTPRSPETFVRVFEGLYEIVPRRGAVGRGQRRHERAVFIEQGVDGFGYVFGTEISETRQTGKIEKRIHTGANQDAYTAGARLSTDGAGSAALQGAAGERASLAGVRRLPATC